jgi:hypothetical protein
VASTVYDHLLGGGASGFDSCNAAAALNIAVLKMRDLQFPFHQWISFIHIGV